MIEHPSPTVKAMQRWLVKNLIANYPVHRCAAAYKKGSSIKINALAHVKSRYTLRLDFSDFFPSFSKKGLERFFDDKRSLFSIGSEDVDFALKILCRNGRLTIGAPSSPSFSNAVMYDFDREISDWCLQNKVIYTRYADDLFFSADHVAVLKSCLALAVRGAEAFPYADLTLNKNKTAFLSRKYKRSITGLIITPERKISIGLARKREIKSKLYGIRAEQPDIVTLESLKGYLAFVRDVEPSFFETLKRKYPAQVAAVYANGGVRSKKSSKSRSVG